MPMTSSSRPVPRRGRAAGASRPAHADAFFRQIVAGMRNGVLAITRPGAVAAAIGNEVKNPLAGIEVMAGLLRRKFPDIPEAQAVLTNIIEEAKMANAIVQEVLEFVRPIRLQVEHTGIAEALHAAVQLADTKAARGSIVVAVNVPEELPQIQADHHQLAQLFTNLLINAYEAMDGRGRVAIGACRVQQDDGGGGRHAGRS